MRRNNLRADIISWNNRFPLDRRWRKKYNVSYLSEEHRKSTFFTQYFDYLEDQVFEEFYKEIDKEKEELQPEYIPMSGNWWSGLKSSKKEMEDWFNKPL